MALHRNSCGFIHPSPSVRLTEGDCNKKFYRACNIRNTDSGFLISFLCSLLFSLDTPSKSKKCLDPVSNLILSYHTDAPYAQHPSVVELIFMFCIRFVMVSKMLSGDVVGFSCTNLGFWSR